MTNDATSHALPDGWVIRVSRSKSKVYYYNTRTKATQWTRPLSVANSKRQRSESTDEQATEEKETQLQSRIRIAMRVGGSIGAKNKRIRADTTPFTPWSHQLRAIEKVITAIQQAPQPKTTQRFLLQHSTGAGKTMTMAALTHQLLYFEDADGARFHTIVIMLDRIKLDEQVGDIVEAFLHRNGIEEVFRAESIGHLAKLLSIDSQQRVIITTIQKMGLLVKDDVLLTRLLHQTSRGDDNAGGVADKTSSNTNEFSRIGILTDEAHRSHTASTREAIQRVMAAGEEHTTPMTFIGFTATPNTEALQLFGSVTDKILHPFDCYSIDQAIKDLRIMNVLQNYVCIRFDIETAIPTDVMKTLIDECALRSVLDFASESDTVLKVKALLMMEDFEGKKVNWSKAKADLFMPVVVFSQCMIVARSRRDVVRYHTLVSTYCTNRQLGWNVYAAFSGTLALDDGVTYVSEQNLNGTHNTLAISDVVIVCDKLDTGYNDPMLASMYIDRYLRSSTQTVQLLSRLNRRNKDKSSVHIMDFANHAAQIRRSFTHYWQEARVPFISDAIDEPTEISNFVTGVTILCDFLPTLYEDNGQLSVSRIVEENILHLERDSFQQVLDALRLSVSAWNRLHSRRSSHHMISHSPISHKILLQLKKKVESHISAKANEPRNSVEEIKYKMSTRVHHYQKSFIGSIFPQSLLARSTDSCCLSDGIINLLKFGPLEKFELFLALLGLHKHRQSIDDDVKNIALGTDQNGTAPNREVTSVEHGDRIRTQISKLRGILVDLLEQS